MMRALHCLLLLVCSISVAFAAEPKHTYTPPAVYVPDAATAIKIAVAVWEPIYGVGQIADEKPYHATPQRGVWTVTGSLPQGMNGGVALAEISQEDGRIMRISHGK